MDSWDFISCEQIQCFNNVKRKKYNNFKIFQCLQSDKMANVKF